MLRIDDPVLGGVVVPAVPAGELLDGGNGVGSGKSGELLVGGSGVGSGNSGDDIINPQLGRGSLRSR